MKINFQIWGILSWLATNVVLLFKIQIPIVINKSKSPHCELSMFVTGSVIFYVKNAVMRILFFFYFTNLSPVCERCLFTYSSFFIWSGNHKFYIQFLRQLGLQSFIMTLYIPRKSLN
jgi:hypothetical protein